MPLQYYNYAFMAGMTHMAQDIDVPVVSEPVKCQVSPSRVHHFQANNHDNCTFWWTLVWFSRWPLKHNQT